jgi:hypothetical protein
MSRRHARIIHRADRFVLHDEDTPPGTYLNNRQIRGLSPLRHGDRIQIGDFEAILELPQRALDEAQWLISTDTQAMLSWLRVYGRTSERQLRLFAAACCRHFGLLNLQANTVAALELVEQYAESRSPKDALSHGNPLHCAVWSADA